MSEWAHPFAIGVGLVYTVAGLAKFYGLKDFYRREVFTPWSEVFPFGFKPDPQIYSYVFGCKDFPQIRQTIASFTQLFGDIMGPNQSRSWIRSQPSVTIHVWEAFSGFILLWPSKWSDQQACFGLMLSSMVVAYNAHLTKRTDILVWGILQIVMFIWLFFLS